MTMRNLRHILFLMLLVLGTASGWAQRVKIFGTVRDQQGAPVELASVRIQGTSIITATDLKGKWRLVADERGR